MNPIKIALAQIACIRADKNKNIDKMKSFIEEARKKDAKLVIFPELSLTGYVLRDLLYEIAELVPGPSVKKIAEIARENGLYIVFGMPEKSEKAESVIYNTAVLVGPEGYIGKYRKMYLPTHSAFEEKRYFRPGYGTPVFKTELGKIGLMICYDTFFPEVSRALKLRGAQIIICISASPAVRRNFFETLIAARAIENNTFVIYVNLVGIEEGLQFWGGSRIISPSGSIIKKAKYDKEDLVVGEIDLDDIKHVAAFVPTIRDLRPELYEQLKREAETI